MIKNFVFDMGNVLMDFSPDYILSRFTDDIEVIDLLKSKIFSNEYWGDLDQGTRSFDEVCELVKPTVDLKYHDVLSRFFNEWHLHKVPNNEMTELVKELKEKGYGIYLCSNAAGKFHEYKHTYPVFEYFDHLTLSADIKISKPSPEIYEYVLETNNLDPETCLFVDDLGPNIQGAKESGMYTYLFNGNTKLFRSYLKAVHLI